MVVRQNMNIVGLEITVDNPSAVGEVEGIGKGSSVSFDFVYAGKGEYEITAIRPQAAAAPAKGSAK